MKSTTVAVVATLFGVCDGFSAMLRTPTLRAAPQICARGVCRTTPRERRISNLGGSASLSAIATVTGTSIDSPMFDDTVGVGDEVVVKWVAQTTDGAAVAAWEGGHRGFFSTGSKPQLPPGVMRDSFSVGESHDVADAVHLCVPNRTTKSN